MIHITSEAELHRANIEIAWSFAHRMTPDQFAELCRLTAREFRRESNEMEASHAG
ncbi:MAG: hypothetical protein NTAFB01_13100 [Nitrospira sp.]